jgi:CheY-like chemotaxis protein
LRQILVNLLGNADKFTERGEIVLNVERAAPDGVGAPVKLRFSVRDTGIGIAKDKLDVIFSTFGQADTSTTRRYGGSGLGLAIVRKLVGLYGGEITVESELGVGSCFTFVANFGVGHALETVKSARVDLRDLEVLVVDDTAVNRLILREILERRGARVTEAESGASALSEVARRAGRPFDLMLLDCRMPSMDGFELAKRVRQFCIGNGTPPPTVIMLTSDQITLGTARLRDAGLHAYLVKPVRRDELLNAIQMAMGEAKASTRHRPAASDVAGALANLRILLADDSPDNRLLVRAFLAKTGCELVEAEDGSIAFDRFRAARYDLVLMDMRMPVMDGFVATRAIRQWEAENGARHTPIVALTASALNEAVRECLEAGCDAHVSKPVKRATLIDAIRRELRGSGDSEAEAPGASRAAH